MLTTILFDLDGTLIDSPKIIMQGFEAAISKHVDNYQLTHNEKTEILGMTLTMAFNRFQKDENHLQEMINTFRNKTEELTLKMLHSYENAENVIKYLKRQGYKVGIVTSKSRKVVEMNLELVGLNNLFDIIITSDDTTLHKPNPEPLIYATKKLGVEFFETIYIGDHENDIIAGNNALMKTGLMKYSYRFNEALEHQPTYIFDDLNHLKKIF